ncbi:bile acid:sodium symporter [Sandaracinobacter sp. RS1-74]|uniref:bile acid:sodium symporter family protein n=1 Tax=Sandaracinobacteroides sayramensis TaxID=2913411 RepID=UPI001EDA46AA|nr:bile acid:sodium symporter family protein [Sandaracinobacteroides sayramensis]MCG2839904.1 bile acid:sodium symporter [Sandaracinobacteroides sayramensis]
MIRALLDPFLLLLVGMVALASVAPAQGETAIWLGHVADAAIFLLFFLHGARLPHAAVKDGLLKWRLHLAVLGSTYLLFPLIGLGLVHSGIAGGVLATGILFLTLVPSTVQSSIAFTAMARGDVAAAVVSAAFSNIAGLFLTPLLVALILKGSGAAMSANAVGTILVQLLLPFVAGHLLHARLGGFLQRHRPLTMLVDRGSILLVVYAAFSHAVVMHLWDQLSATDLLLLAALSILILGLVLAATWWAGKALGFPLEDRVVLLFCGSKKSLASGVPMAGVLFAPTAVGLAILPLMLFHQIQLIACAVIARRLADRAEPERT